MLVIKYQFPLLAVTSYQYHGQVCPPVLVLSPLADRIHYALENHPSFGTISKLVHLILSTASEKIWLQESDNASANERLYNYRLSTNKNNGLLRELVVCHNHQNNLAEGSLVAATHTSLISDFFSFTHFVQAGTHFAKLKAALRIYIQEHATVTAIEFESSKNDQVVEYYNDFLDELLDMHARVHTTLTHVHSKTNGQEESKDVSHRLQKKITFFRQMWNQQGFGHTCRRVGPQERWCCQSDADATSKMASSLIDLALSSLPETPAPGKWTKLWSCLQFPSCD